MAFHIGKEKYLAIKAITPKCHRRAGLIACSVKRGAAREKRQDQPTQPEKQNSGEEINADVLHLVAAPTFLSQL